MKLYDDQLILLTGGAGFIGSCFIRYLNDRGVDNIIVVDDLKKGLKWRNLVGKNFLNIISRHKLFDWLRSKESSIAAIVHLGACSDTVEQDADYFLENNYRFSIKLAEYALRHDKRFIYASSAATYGDGSLGFSDDHDHIPSLHPLNMYGYSKHLFDLWLLNQAVLDRVVGLKFFNVFGPNEIHKERMASSVTKMVPQILKEGKVRLFQSNDPKLYANGEQKRDFIYVKDVVRMIYRFLIDDHSGIFNIGSGIASTWNQLALATFKALGVPPLIEYVPMPEDLNGRYQNYTLSSMEKTRQALKEDAYCRSLDESVMDYISHYLKVDRRW